jgi:integrase
MTIGWILGLSANMSALAALDPLSTKQLLPRFGPNLAASFVSDLIDSGADLSVTQRLAGHSSITTTAGYDRRPEARKREAAERLQFPWR